MAFSFITRFLSRTTSEAAGFGLGGAMRSPLEPPLQELTNETWRAFVKAGVTVPTEPGDAAEIVAEDVALESWGADQVAQLGYGGDQFDKLVNAVRNGPGFGELLEARRRNLIDDAQFKHGLRKLRLETLWDDALTALLGVLLSPSELANARQQGFVDEARQKQEAALQGISDDRAEIQFELSGLPPGVDVLQRALNRNLIDEATFAQGIREGHTKTKYTDLLDKMRHPLLSAATGVRLYLKGWYTQQQRDDLGAQWGYTPQQMEDWYLSEGRPATVHQIHIGYARGATLPGAANEEDAIRKSVKESDIRPEYADLLVAQRYTYPSAFALRGLVEGGSLTAAEGEQVLLYSGWEPTLARRVAQSWAGSASGTATDAHVSKAQTQLWNTVHSSYKGYEISAATATQALPQAGVDSAAIPAILAVWNEERALIRSRLTAANIAKAYQKQVLNPATGVAWTKAEAIAELLQLGFDRNDAETRIEI